MIAKDRVPTGALDHRMGGLTLSLGANRLSVPGRPKAKTGPVRSLFSGYAKSKYVAETLIQKAHRRGLPVMIYRPSNIMGSTTSGICPPASFVTKMIQSYVQIGLAPDIDAVLNLVPVDYVSRAVMQLSQVQVPEGQAFNIVNPLGLPVE